MREFRRRSRRDCAIFAVDEVWNARTVSFSLDTQRITAEFRPRSSPDTLLLADARAVWWRRPFAKQTIQNSSDVNEERFVNQECRAAYWGAMLVAFKGKWVSAPEATIRASNKIFQLSVAKDIGFRIPKTIVSQSRTEVLSFYESCRRQVIVKSLVGIENPMLFTRRLSNPKALGENAYSNCPAIFQELIPGHRHMRLSCFGDKAFAALIESEELDWRPNLNVPVYNYDVPPDLHDKARSMLRKLGLEMGVFDLKETPEGEWVWLEVNPQGQFLFLEPSTHIPLAEYFTDFLIQSANEVS
jgi:glutathione synthase/RimK-type ligase-like ATP-grasp enzyme